MENRGIDLERRRWRLKYNKNMKRNLLHTHTHTNTNTKTHTHTYTHTHMAEICGVAYTPDAVTDEPKVHGVAAAGK